MKKKILARYLEIFGQNIWTAKYSVKGLNKPNIWSITFLNLKSSHLQKWLLKWVKISVFFSPFFNKCITSWVMNDRWFMRAVFILSLAVTSGNSVQNARFEKTYWKIFNLFWKLKKIVILLHYFWKKKNPLIWLFLTKIWIQKLTSLGSGEPNGGKNV